MGTQCRFKEEFLPIFLSSFSSNLFIFFKMDGNGDCQNFRFHDEIVSLQKSCPSIVETCKCQGEVKGHDTFKLCTLQPLAATGCLWVELGYETERLVQALARLVMGLICRTAPTPWAESLASAHFFFL